MLLNDVFKGIMDETGKNLVFSPGLENRLLTAYIQNSPFSSTMDKLAFANNLYILQRVIFLLQSYHLL